jgi:hypothetical protein
VKLQEDNLTSPVLGLGAATGLKRNIRKKRAGKSAQKELDLAAADRFADLNSNQLTEYRGRNRKLASMREYEQGKIAS